MDLFNDIQSDRVVICDYCGHRAKLCTGRKIYPRRPDLANKKFWACSPCGAHVGCHADSDDLPLGRLANAELRAAKRIAHAALDPLWRDYGMSRAEAYSWLANQLGINVAECHIGLFDVSTCRRVTERCNGMKLQINSDG